MNKLFYFFTIALLFALGACSDSTGSSELTRFSEYVLGHTSGVISKKATVIVELTQPSKKFTSVGALLEDEVFDFSPAVSGQAYWRSPNSIEFIPEELASGTEYTVNLFLGDIADADDSHEEFEFKFFTITQAYALSFQGLNQYDPTNLQWNQLKGVIRSADYAEALELEKQFELQLAGEDLIIQWTHNNGGTFHQFQVDSIERVGGDQTIEIEFAAQDDFQKTFIIPSIASFKVMSVDVINVPQQVVIKFSDALQANQDLNGLVRFKESSSIKIEKSGNEVKLLPTKRLSGKFTVAIEPGVKNVNGYKFDTLVFHTVEFVELDPAVKLVNHGTILPSTNGLIYPFEAVNLKAVKVKVTKVFENNVLRYFQDNRHNGDYKLHQVGRLVAYKRVNLNPNGNINLSKWNRFTLNLEEFISADPGAIYRVHVDFNMEDAIIPCIINQDLDEPEELELDEYEIGQRWYTDYSNYRWSEKENPCHVSYYIANDGIESNVLSSNLGITAKLGDNRKLLVAVADIRTAETLNGIEVEIYDSQNQLIVTGQTNSQGKIELELKRKPFLLIAKNRKERGYLRLDDGNSLSVSNFKVSGQRVQNGIKGFIFGERGVWRPGDTLHLGFIVEDALQNLPENAVVTMKIFDPRGVLQQKVTPIAGLNGFYTFKIKTHPDDVTGTWRAQVKVGAATFTKNLRIETVMPNRLKIKVHSTTEFFKANQKGELNISANWLSGATAKSLETKVSVILSKAATSFEGYEQFDFSNYAVRYESHEDEVISKKLSDQGLLTVPVNLKTKSTAGGMLNATFVTRVFEAGGAHSINRSTFKFSPYQNYVGLQLNKSKTYVTDTTNYAQVVALTAEGKPLDKRKLTVNVYEVSWSWWWNISNNNQGYYTSSNKKRLIKSEEVTTKNGKAQISWRVNYPDWGRYLIEVADGSGHKASQFIYMDWPEWVSRENRESPEGATMLTFATDKEKYQIGEYVNVTIPATENGMALVSIENGEGVLSSEWVKATGKEINYGFKTHEKMAPNVFVSVNYIQPHQRDNDLPIRRYGIVPIEVLDSNTILKPTIKMADKLAPEEVFKVTVSEQNKMPMTYTLAVVDEGLLDLTNFKTPKPHPWFYAKEALGVKTFDMYNDVIGAYGAQIEQLLSIGGDGAEVDKDKTRVNRFKSVVEVLGPFEYDGSDQTHKIKMPNYIGSVKVMVVAAQDAKYGHADKTVPVKTPLMVLGTLPRTLSPGDEVKLPVSVFAMEDHVKDVKVQIKSNSILKFESTSSAILFDEPGEQTINFPFSVGMKEGVAKVEILVSSGNEKASYEVEVAVRNPNPFITENKSLVLKPGQTISDTFSLIGVSGSNTVSFEVSSLPPIELNKRLNYLIQYPHGCLEQTVSKGFPQIFLEDLTDLPEAKVSEVNMNISATLDALRTFQNNSGGFGYWPGANNVSDFGSTYAGHFLIEAEANGFTAPLGMKKKWLTYQAQAAKNYYFNRGYYWSRRNQEFIQAYRLFTLALAGEPEMGAMNRLRTNNKLNEVGLWRLAAAYYMVGQKEIANSMVARLTIPEVIEIDYSYSYGSYYRDLAMILEAMVIMNKTDQAAIVFKTIAEKLSSKTWLSTQTTSYMLLAASKFVSYQKLSGDVDVAYKIDNKQLGEIVSQSPITVIDLKDYSQNKHTYSFTNNGKGLVYLRLNSSGKPAVYQPESFEKGMGLNVYYTDLSGKKIDISNLRQGQDFIAVVVVTNSSTVKGYADLALTQIFPSGWEIRNTRMDDESLNLNSITPDYQDIRDDRVMTYFPLKKSGTSLKKTATFKILLNASYLGKYYLPPVFVSSMYDDNIGALVSGKWVEVTE